MKFRLLFFATLLSFVQTLNAQPFFQRVTYPSSAAHLNSRSYSFFADGSAVALLSINDPAHGVNNGAAFAYINSNGNTAWMRGSDSLGAHGAVQLAGGDLVVLGYSRYLGTPGLTASDGNFVLTRFTAGGTVVWTKAFGDQYDDFGNYMHLLPNGNIEVYGFSENYAAGSSDNFRARISPAGNLLEMKFQSSTNTTFSDFYDYDPVTGYTYAAINGTAGTFYVKCIDSTFNILWENRYTTNFSTITSICAAPNGTVLAAGTSGITVSAIRQPFLINISATGSTLWTQKYDFAGEGAFMSVDMAPSGIIVATGYTPGYSAYTYQGDYENRTITFSCTSTGTPISGAVYGNNVAATGYRAFAKNDSVFYFAAEHGLKNLADSYMILRVDSTLSNPVFCFERIMVPLLSLSLTSTPFPSAYTLYADTVQVVNENANYQSIPVSNILICPTLTHVYQTNGEAGKCVTATSDSCFVFVTNYGGMKMTKYDPEGNIKWSHKMTFTTPYYPGYGYDIMEASNGDLIVGHGAAGTSNGGHACLLRTDPDGNPIWCTDKSVGGNEVSRITEVIETPGHDFVTMAGFQQGTTAGRFAIIKYDSLGNSIWAKEYANVQSGPGAVDADANRISANGNGIYNAYVLETDTSGTVIWSKEISNAGPTSQVVLSFTERCPNGDILHAGYTHDSSPLTYQRPYLIRFDSLGNVVWQKMYMPGSEMLSHTVSVIQLSGDQYVITALGPGGSTANYKSFTFKIDGMGNVLWARCMMPTSGGGIEYSQGDVGYDSSLAFPASEYSNTTNFRFDKLSSAGQGPCGTVTAAITVSVPATTSITNANLSAFSPTLTETALTASFAIDSSGRTFICAAGDTGFYYHVDIEEPGTRPLAEESSMPHKIYPVPTSGALNIDGFLPGLKCTVNIYNVNGQLAHTETTMTDAAGICTATFGDCEPGVYFIYITGPDGVYLVSDTTILQ